MTRFSNPLPHNQTPNGHQVPNPNTQGRPAAPGQQPQSAYPHAPRPEYDAAAWGQAGQQFSQPGQAGVPRTQGRPASANPYGETQAPVHSDPYAALRPDGFGYTAPKAADPYGLAGYTAPQPPAASNPYSRAPQAPAQPQGYPPAQSDPYGAYAAPQPAQSAPSSFAATSAQQGQAYGSAGQGYVAPPPPASYGSGYGANSPANGGYAEQWGGQSPAAQPGLGGGQSLSVDARDYGHGGFGGPDAGQHNQWGGDAYGESSFEPALGAALGGMHAPGAPAPGMGHGYGGAPQAQHASFDQSYAEDEGAYEEEPRRGSWKKVVGLVACTVLIGGVLSIAYSSIMGSNSGEPTPVVKGAEGPSKVKPSDPGGKKFAHADSKIMGRLGEGGVEAPGGDVSGVRKVPVVTVGRDGSIQPPASTQAAAPSTGSEETTRAVVAVPGLTVIDGLDNGPNPNRPVGPKAAEKAGADKAPPVQMVTASTTPERPVVVSPPPVKTVKVEEKAAAKPEKVAKQLANTEETAALPAPKKQKVASLDPAPPASTGPKPSGAGYVAVLASVPASGSSRMDALKQFADMQQKYGSILTNKTPDIQEANLGERGTYHRLLVGPPGSRDAASSVCTQLKAEGYAGCWVTAY
jgi:hypothetical protein